MATAKGKGFSYSEGRYGHRVRVFARPGRGSLYIEFWDPAANKMVPRSLKHSDEELARQQCRDLSDALRLGNFEVGTGPSTMAAATTNGNAQGPSGTQTNGASARDTSPVVPAADGPLPFIGWKTLFRLYHERVGQHKKGTGPEEGRRRAKVWVAYFRGQTIATPFELDKDDLLEFVRKRVSGSVRVPFVKLKTEVSTETAWADLVFLVTVLNWAVDAKDPRQPTQKLLLQNTLRVPGGMKNKNPQRPVDTHDDLLCLRSVANSVDPQRLFRDFERIHDLVGWRVTGMCSVSAADVSLEPEPGMPYGFIRKNFEVDKEGVGDAVPLSRRGAATVRSILKTRGIEAGDDAWLFPAPKDASKPWSRWRVRDLTKRAQRAASLKHLGGSHAVRRKWASERKDYPTKDVMKAGGWKDPRSLAIYTQDDVETTYEVVSRPTRRVRRPRAVNHKK